MAERWRSSTARQLAAAVRRAGGQVERTGRGKLRITGPGGEIIIHEPGASTRRDLRRDSPARRIEEATGLRIT